MAASEKYVKERPFGRATRFVVLPVEAVRTLNVRSDEEVVQAQKLVDEDMLKALEEMVNAAKAGKLEGRQALSIAAAAW
jgi:hypothetical protein